MSQPSSTAPIIIIDLQIAMFHGIGNPPHDAEGLVSRVRDVMDWARRTGRKIAFVRHNGPPGDQMAPGAPGWPVLPALGQTEADPTFGKTEKNAFANPSLGDWVLDNKADEIVVLGAATNHCVAATVSGALAQGLKVTVVADGHSTGGPTAPQIIRDANRAFAEAGARLVMAADLKP